MKNPRSRQQVSSPFSSIWRSRLMYSIAALGLVLLILSNKWVNAATWASTAEAALHDTVETFARSRSLLRTLENAGEANVSEESDFGPPSRLDAWDCPPTPAFSRRAGLNRGKLSFSLTM
jgi:hypothetical protein